MRTVVLIRHAKSARPAGVADLNRPLSDRGLADAQAAGDLLREVVGRPTLLACSPARRAIQTADRILAAYRDDPPPVRYEQRLYEATVADLLETLAGWAAPAELSGASDHSLVVVGHNPSVSGAVGALTGERLLLRTCGIAVIAVPAAGALIEPGSGTLLSCATPRAGRS